MKKLLTFALLFCAIIANAQEHMYIMKGDVVVGKYNVRTEIDSIIFYQPNADPGAFVTDADGNVYSVVTIGTQTWMAENLKTTKYNDGTEIPLVNSLNQWGTLTTPGYCWYGNEPAYGSVYGALYNWYTVNTGKLCPVGWHVPTDAEWTTLTNFLGGLNQSGAKMKEKTLIYWRSPNGEATNESGFTALPAGLRYYTNPAIDGLIGERTIFWTGTEENANNARFRRLSYIDGQVVSSNSNKGTGNSIRCLKD